MGIMGYCLVYRSGFCGGFCSPLYVVTFLFYLTYVVTCSAVTLFRLCSAISYFGLV